MRRHPDPKNRDGGSSTKHTTTIRHNTTQPNITQAHTTTKPTPSPSWRGIFEGQRVGKFRSAKDCHAARRLWNAPSNPLGDPFRQYISVVVGWAQLREHIFPVLEASRRALDRHACADAQALRGVPEECKALWRCRPHKLLSRDTAFEATRNTWEYLYRTMRCGIFVRISGGKVVLFVPFVNPEYRNDWADSLQFEGGSFEAYCAGKAPLLTFPEEVLPDRSRWWCNGNILCNVCPRDLWGDAYLPQLRDMLDVTCDLHDVPDVEFFVNKRDFPQLRKDLTSPYAFMYPPADRPHALPAADVHPVFAPVMSFYGSAAFADVLIPTAEDWEVATGDVFPPYGLESRTRGALRAAAGVPWAERKPVMLFRGGATGGGVDPLTNLRLAVAALDGLEGFDVGVVKWNVRDKKLADEVCVRHVKPDRLPFGLKPYMGLEEQGRYKYHLYIDGHCAANRLGTMMTLGALIVRVTPPPLTPEEPHHQFPDNEGGQSWLLRHLRPFDWRGASADDATRVVTDDQDHIPCSVYDLPALLPWLRAHDDVCLALARNAARKAARLLTVDAITAYWARVLLSLHRRTQGGSYSRWFSPTDAGAPGPVYPPRAPRPPTAGSELDAKRLKRFSALLEWDDTDWMIQEDASWSS